MATKMLNIVKSFAFMGKFEDTATSKKLSVSKYKYKSPIEK